MTLKVDGRSRMGKFIRSLIDDPLPSVCISQGTHGGYVLGILNMAPFQEQSVCEAADRAALEVIKNSLDVEGYVIGYLT